MQCNSQNAKSTCELIQTEIRENFITGTGKTTMSFFFFKQGLFYLLFIFCMCLRRCMQCLKRPEEGSGLDFPGAGFAFHCGCWEPNAGPLQEQRGGF